MGGQEACCLQEQRDVLHMEDYTVSPVSERMRKLRIVIESVERGWETVRRIELPEDEGLVKSILRSVKRRLEAPETKESTEPETVKPAPEPVKFETGHKGFLILSCAGCGKTWTVNAREPVVEAACKVCGQVTQLPDVMAEVVIRCTGCGKEWRYRTNSEQAEVTARCIQCGALMASRWNSEMRKYLPHKKENEKL